MRITKTVVDKAVYEGNGRTRHILWDDDVSGFGLRVYPSGRKSFIVSYRAGTRQRLMTLGQYGVLTIQQARDMAKRKLADVLDGDDPLMTRKRARQGMTIRQLADRYLKEHAIPKKKPKSVAEDRRQLDKYVLPVLGSRIVQEITRDDVSRLHHSLRETPIQANRVLALISKLMSLAEKWELRPDGSNPCRHVDHYPERQRERYLSGDELARLGAVLTEAEETRAEMPEVIAAIRLLLLTGCRRDEILTLKWQYIDFERGFLLLPDSKTGAKVVPLGSAALTLLSGLPRLDGSPYVLPGRGGKRRLVGLHHPWVRLRKKAGLEDVRLHDLRHSFASVGAGGGLGLPILGKLLGHTQPSTTARYSHLAEDPLRRAADQIAREIETQMKG